LTELAPEKIEAINFTAEFTKAFSLGGKAHVRSLFEDTGKSRDGEKARLFRCLRCRFETTENATRFARHILKCPSATEKDRAVAQDHEALTKRRREMRLRQPLPPEAPDADSTPQIEENSSPHGDSVAAPGSKSSSRGGSSVDERLPSPASDTDINRGMNRTTAAGGASRVVSSAPSDDLFPGLDLEPGLPGSEARALSADFLDAAFVDSLASHAPWTGCGMPEGLGHPQATTESSEPMGRSTGGWQPVPDWGGQMPADGFGQSGGGGGLLDGHLLHSGLAPAQAAVAPSSVGLGGATLPGAGSGGWAGPQPWPWGSGGGSSPNPWAMGTGVSQPHPELSDASAGQYALPGKRQRPGGDQQEQRIRPDVSLSEWMEFRQWKQRQQQEGGVPRMVGSANALWEALYGYFITYAKRCAEVYKSCSGSFGPVSSTKLVARQINEDWKKLGSVFRTIVQCCTKQHLQMVCSRAKSQPERVLELYNATIQLANDSVTYGLNTVLKRRSSCKHLMSSAEQAIFCGLEKAFECLTTDEDGNPAEPNPGSIERFMATQYFAARHGPGLRDLVMVTGTMWIGPPRSSQFSALPPIMGVSEDGDLDVAPMDLDLWAKANLEFLPLLDDISADRSTAVASIAWVNEIYNRVGWDMCLVV